MAWINRVTMPAAYSGSAGWFPRAMLPLVPAAAFYVLIVYFTRFTSWDGLKDLYAQHAFLVPMPFFGL